MDAASPRFAIQGRTVTLPVEVRDASAGTALYLVDAHVARRLLPGDEVEPVEAWPGRALLSLGMIDYRDNDLGDYDEISVAFFVRERGGAGRARAWLGGLAAALRGDVGTAIHRLPVNQSFTCEAGRRIWGFPKTVDEIAIERVEGRAVCTWSRDGSRVFRFSVPRGGSRVMADRTLSTYTWMEGVAHRTAFTSGASGVGVRLGGAELELGSHPIADELRVLGLPRRALLTTWMERMHGRFEAPRKLG